MRRFQVLWLAVLLTVGACAGTNRDPLSQYSAGQLQEMGEKYLAAGDVPQAIKFLSIAEQKRPKDPLTQYNLGLAYGSRGLQNESIAHFQKAIQLRQDYSEAYNALGALYAEQEQYDLAIYNIEKALANPYYETPYFALFNLGRIYEKKNDPELALKQYREAVRLRPYYGAAYFRMGQVLETLKRGDEAREAYGKATEFSPDQAEAHLRYGAMSYTAGDLEAALYSLSKVIKLAPRSAMASEARKYLESLRGIVGPEGHKTASSSMSEKISQLEVVAEKDIQNPEPAVTPRAEPVTQKTKTGFEQGEMRIAAKTSAPPKEKQKDAPLSPPPGTRWTYIIQVGSFLDKENAETVVKRLKSRGFNVVLKHHTHQVLGPIYVVQHAPVEDADKASSLMARIEGVEEVKPVIIKLPATP